MGSIVVDASFQVTWDADEFREAYEETLSDDELLQECRAAVQAEFGWFAAQADVTHVEARLA